MTAPRIAPPWHWPILRNRRPLYLRGELYVLFSRGFGHAGLGHSFPDAGECRFAGFFLSFVLRHTSMMTWGTAKLCWIDETSLLPSSGMLGLCSRNSLQLHRVKGRICLAQESLDRLAVLWIGGKTEADGELW